MDTAAELDTELRGKVDRILGDMTKMERMVVALSGGVDSSTVAALAQRALGENALAVTAVSETLPERELVEARAVAHEIGIRHQLLEFSELADEQFRENTASRCYFCQSMRFDQLHEIARRLDYEVVASGTNYSDSGDHRPGLQAMKEQRVYQPLLEYEIEKEDVRRLAQWLGLSVWNKPAKACLSSRIPHGLQVTQERLQRIEKAEEVLYHHDFRQFRVRDHDGLARVEVAPREMDRLLDPEVLSALASGIRESGFRAVTVDLGGYQSGNLNPTSESGDHE
jgi:uncharacterized protein (TIGR00268 family)